MTEKPGEGWLVPLSDLDLPRGERSVLGAEVRREITGEAGWRVDSNMLRFAFTPLSTSGAGQAGRTLSLRGRYCKKSKYGRARLETPADLDRRSDPVGP